MAASRIFIKNLPPNLKEEDFKNYFSSLAPVTDAKFIPKRRIGYVGYKTPETAIKATKYFNKSFIRTSRIHVELAKPVAESQPKKKAKFQDDVPQRSAEAQTKQQDEAESLKLQEFLSTMGAPSHGKTWANEEAPAAVPLIVAEPLPDDDEVSDGEYQTISKKRKRDHEHEESGQPKTASVMPIVSGTKEIEASNSDASPLSHVNTGVDQEENNPLSISEGDETAAVPASDSDWLRSKTNRLLELVDDDELDQDAHAANHRETSEAEGTNNEEAVLPILSRSPEHKDTIHDTGPPETSEAIHLPDTTNTGRLFIRNLSYDTTESELQALLAEYGVIEEIHVSRDTRSGISKGYCYAQFNSADEAQAAKESLDGKPFQGRLLHILYAKNKKPHGLDEYQISKLPLKKQQEIRRKMEASTSTFKWNSMYMSPDAILSSVATRLGVSKTDLLDPTSIDAAVKQAHAETNLVKEAKAYFASHGVNLDAFKGKEYSDKAILVKNFPYGTSTEELKKMFEVYGTVSRLLIPPSATIAVVEMEQATQSKSALHSLAYRKFKDSVLFLEKAPKALFTSNEPISKETAAPKPTTSDLLAQEESTLAAAKSTLFIRNLNFSTTSLDLRDLFMPLNGFLSATVKTKQDSKRPGQTLSMGFGFVEFRTKEDAQSAMAAMNGYKLAGHELMIKESNKAIDAAEERRREDAAKKLAGQRTKIIIRNLPFEATKKDVRALFGPYGQLRTVRVPRKHDNTSRGFAFAEFVTSREAENAVKSLAGIHLLGRRLNLEFAVGDTLDAEEEIEKMSKKVSKQADKVAIQNLTTGGRKKFSVHQGEDDD